MRRLWIVALVACTMTESVRADVVTGTDSGALSNVKVINAAGMDTSNFLAYGAAFTGGVRVAAGDLNGDGFADIITGAGQAGSGHVKVFDGSTGAEIRSFLAYGGGYTGGVFVGGGDVNNDFKADVITGADSGVAPHVKVFDGISAAEIRSFFAYGPGFTGGVRVASGDINGDGFADIITGAGQTGSGHIKVFDGSTGAEIRSFLAYGVGYSGGAYVAGGDVNNDGFADLVTGTDEGVLSHVKVFDGTTGAEIRSFFAYGGAFTGGVRVAAGDIDGDGFADIITGAGDGGSGHIKVFDGNTGAETLSFLAYGSGYSRGVYVAGSDFVVPEPTSAALLSLAGLGLAIGRLAQGRR